MMAQHHQEVIVSAGAINSPKLLLLSGIGAADDLRAAGVACVHDLPGSAAICTITSTPTPASG